MKIVFDTNVLIASLISHGACFELFEYCTKNHLLYTSEYIINEFEEKLKFKFKYSKKIIQEAKSLIFQKIHIIELIDNKNIDFSDKKDIQIINTAISSNSDLLITGDKKLYELKKINKIKIIKPADFWKNEEKR